MRSKFKYMHSTQFYDPQFNLLYVMVSPRSEKKGLSKLSSYSEEVGVTNIMLWDIPKKQKKAIFADQELAKGEYISHLLFETGHSADKNERTFNDYQHVFNNHPLTTREAVNKLLIATHHQTNKEITLWFADKFGFDKFKIATFSDANSWQLDVRNGDIRIIEQLDNDIKVLELRWYL